MEETQIEPQTDTRISQSTVCEHYLVKEDAYNAVCAYGCGHGCGVDPVTQEIKDGKLVRRNID